MLTWVTIILSITMVDDDDLDVDVDDDDNDTDMCPKTHCVTAAVHLQRRHSPIPNLSNDNDNVNPQPDQA